VCIPDFPILRIDFFHAGSRKVKYFESHN
jgi:hypothetical protein